MLPRARRRFRVRYRYPDRLARNSKDGGELIHFLDVGHLVDLKFCTFWFENTPQGKSNLGHEFVQTKQYSDKLACDTRRGLQDKARLGNFPAKAPRGYINDKGTKTIVLDPHLAPLMKRAFELYAEGNSTIDDMGAFFAENGLVTKKLKDKRYKGGQRLATDLIRSLLRNPFYYGHFRYAGELYEGKHPPIISKQLFDKVQAVIEQRTHHMPAVRDSKPFAQLLNCGECGRSITAEVQKGHTYYRCTKKSKNHKCTQKFVREEELNGQISGLLSQFTLRPDWAGAMLRMLDNERKDAAQSSGTVIREKQAEIAQINGKMQRLLDANLDQLIDREAFAAQKEDLMGKRKVLSEQIDKVEDTQNTWLEPFKEWINTAQTLGETASHGSLTQKRVLARKVFGSNLILDSKKARGSALKPFSYIPEFQFQGEMVGWRGLEPRTNALKGHCSTN